MSEPTERSKFFAWISVDGTMLPSYGVEAKMDNEGRETISSWIASEVDKEFSVCWSVPPYPDGLAGLVWIDGMFIGTKLGFRDTAMGYTISLSRQSVSNTSARPLMFSKVEFTDNDEYLDTTPMDLGEIKLQIWTVDWLPGDPSKPPSQQSPTKIHERSKKAIITHRVAFGKEFSPPDMKIVRYRQKRHLISFIFKYRPRDYLRAEGIMPSNPIPDTRARKRAAPPEPSGSGSNYREELERQNGELEARLDLAGNRQKKRVKLEPQTPAKPQVKPEVIDLT